MLPWLFVTTANLSRNVRRSTRRHRALLTRLPRPGPVSDPAQAYLDSRAFDGLEPELAAALRDLPVLDQQVLGLTALEGFSLEEAGLALGLTTSEDVYRLTYVRGPSGILVMLAQELGQSVRMPARVAPWRAP